MQAENTGETAWSLNAMIMMGSLYAYFFDLPTLVINRNTTMSESAVTIRVRKFMRNPLLKRRQMVIVHFCSLSNRPSRLFILSALLSLRRRLRLTSAKSTTWRTIRPSSSLASRLLSVNTLLNNMLMNRRWQIHWLCSDLRFSERRQEVRG